MPTPAEIDEEIANIFGRRLAEPVVRNIDMDLFFSDGDEKDAPLELPVELPEPVIPVIIPAEEVNVVDEKQERRPLLPKSIYDACIRAANQPSFFGGVQVPRLPFNLSAIGTNTLRGFFRKDKDDKDDIKPSPPNAIRPKR